MTIGTRIYKEPPMFLHHRIQPICHKHWVIFARYDGDVLFDAGSYASVTGDLDVWHVMDRRTVPHLHEFLKEASRLRAVISDMHGRPCPFVTPEVD